MNKMIVEYGLQGKIYSYDYMLNAGSAVNLMPERDYAALINMSDCVVTVGGEGFGYLVAEAFLCKTPVITLGESATGELGAFGRARLVKSESWLTGMEMTERPLPNPKQLAKVMFDAKEGNNQAYVDKAYVWAKENLTQDVIDKKWKRTMHKIEHPLSYPCVFETV